jgi:hypothetical protein
MNLINSIKSKISVPTKKFILEMIFGMLTSGSSNITLIAGMLKNMLNSMAEKKLPDSLDRIEIIHDIPESKKECCGVNKTIIGYEVSEKLKNENS